MTDYGPALVGALAGAATGAVSGALIGWLIAPTRAEREERGRKRVAGRETISEAIVALHYSLSEARRARYRREQLSIDEFEGSIVAFAAAVRRGSAPLPILERSNVRRRARKIVGPGIERLAELRPTQNYAAGGDSARLQAIADARRPDGNLAIELAGEAPTSNRWDRVIHSVEALQRKYSHF